MKRRIVFGFVFALALLVALIGVVGSREVFVELSRADRSVVALGVLSGGLALTFRGLVWNRFLSLVDTTLTLRTVGGMFLTAMFLKYVTPYGQVATEPFVAYLVSQESTMSIEDGLAGIVSADLLNYLPYYTFGFVGLGIIATQGALGDGMRSQLLAFGLLFVVLVTLVLTVVRRPAIIYRLVIGVSSVVRRVTGRFSTRFESYLKPVPVRSRLDSFYETVDLIMTKRSSLLIAVVYAHVGMLFLMAPVYFGGLALGHDIALPVVAVVVALGKLGSVVPAPGGTGGVEAIVTAGLTTLGGLDPASALTVALLYRACTYWLTIGLGGLSAASVFLRR